MSYLLDTNAWISLVTSNGHEIHRVSGLFIESWLSS